MRPLRLLMPIAALLFTANCAPAHRVQVMTVLSNDNCKTTTAGIRLIDYAALAELRGTRLIGMTESPEAAATPLHLIAIVPGESPTPGYSVALEQSMLAPADPLDLHVTLGKPPADAVLAQVITHPCLVVGIDDPTVKRVRVIVDGDRSLGEVDLSKPR